MEQIRQRPSGPALCLNIHAAYACRDAGACCTAGWAIPIEGPAYEAVTLHFGDRLPHRSMFTTGGPLPDGAAAILGWQADRSCVFFEPDRERHCGIHRELGEPRLPVACRQFPRITLQDPRGTLVSLSHYCPTAAGLLASEQPLEIVEAPPTLALDGSLEGLDARDTLPPLLRPGMLMDFEGYDAWERQAIGVLARNRVSVHSALATIGNATRAVSAWRPGTLPLKAAVDRAFDSASSDAEPEAAGADERRVETLLASIPLGLDRPGLVEGFAERWSSSSAAFEESDRAIRYYLAARLFGNWMAYSGTGLHAVVEYLRICLAVLKMEAVRRQAASPLTATSSAWQTVLPAIRSADLLLVHLADTRSLAKRLA